MAAHGSYPAPDGGWGWAVVASSCLGQLVFAMICRSNGVFYLEYLAKFQQSATVTSWVFALMMTMWSGLGPVTTMLCAKFTCRTVSSWGAVLMVIGLMGSAFAPHIGLIYVTSGILGIGLSLNTVPCLIMVGEYFERRKGLAMALSTIGSGIGAFIFPPLLQITFVHYGFTGAMLIVAAISGHALVSALMLRPLHELYGKKLLKEQPCEETAVDEGQPVSTMGEALSTSVLHLYRWPSKQDARTNSLNDLRRAEFEHQELESKSLSCGDIYVKAGRKQKGTEIKVFSSTSNGDAPHSDAPPIEEAKKGCRCRGLPSFDWNLFREVPFLLMFLLSVACAFCFGTGVSFLPALAVQKGIEQTKSAFLLSLFGVLDTICSIPVGFLFDFKVLRTHPKRRVLLYLLLTSVLGVTCTLLPVSGHYSWLVTFSLLRGMGSGVFMSQRMTILTDLMGKARAPKALGFHFLAFTVGSILSRTVGGLFKDYLNTYDPNFYIGGLSATIMCGIFAMYVHFHMDDKHVAEESAQTNRRISA